MNTEISHATAPPKAPVPPTRAEAVLLGVYRSRTRREHERAPWSIDEVDAPKGGDLAVLQDRLAAVSGSLVEGLDRDRAKWIAATVSRLFLRWHVSLRAPPEQVEAFALDLAMYPNWAIAKGISRIIDGLVLKQPEHPPGSIVIRDAVRAAMAPFQDEAADLRLVLTAQVVPPPTPLSLDARKAIGDAARQAMRHNAPPDLPPQKRDTRLASKFDDASKPVSHDSPAVASEALRAVLSRGREA